MNTVLRPLVEELRKAAHQARGREIAAVAERDALRALIDKAGRHWLALDPGVPWEGAIDAAMEAACGEIQRLRTLVTQQREALRGFVDAFKLDWSGHALGELIDKARAVLAQEVPGE